MQHNNSLSRLGARDMDNANATNLDADEIQMLKNGGYKLSKKREMATNDIRYRTRVSEAAAKRIELAISMEATIKGVEVIKQGVHEKKHSTTASQVREKLYEVHIAMSPMCTCKDFIERVGQGRPYIACKHI